MCMWDRCLKRTSGFDPKIRKECFRCAPSTKALRRKALGSLSGNSYVPTKVSFFVWLAYWEKILTMDKLIARGYYYPNRCVMCCKDLESANHLLVHCPVARMVWNFFFNRFGLC